MFCPQCGAATDPEHKFCKSCGAVLRGAASTLTTGAAVTTDPATPQPAEPGAYPGAYPEAPAPPPGMVPVIYQAYPGGPQQLVYVPAHGMRTQGTGGIMDGIRSRIRNLASTDKLEGFSLKELFNETFSKRGPDAVEDYLAAGSSRTTPPLELVDTNWPKPWMFFRVLAGLAIAYAAIYALYIYSANEKPMIAIMVLAALAVPVATLMLIWEMNTPRNVSIVEVIKLFVLGGGISVVFVTLLYLIPRFSQAPGIVEEVSKLLAVILVTYGARGTRFPYQLNGILFGATVGAAFACSETLGYGMDVFGPGLVHFVKSGGLDTILQKYPTGAGVPWGILLMPVMKSTLAELNSRAILSPFGHIVWSGIAAGAFWRVKGDRTASPRMLMDGRFLRAFILPVALHQLWDSPLAAGSNNTVIQWAGMSIIAAISWYVMFTLIQQGLHQVRDLQKAQLQHTLDHVEATLGLGTRDLAMQPQGQAGD